MSFILLCSGASASGKTTLSQMLKEELLNRGISTFLIPMDNYYRAREPNTPELTNFDVPDAFDLPLLRQHLQDINGEKTVEMPQFSFAVKNRIEQTINLDPKEFQVVILEGIHASESIISSKLPKDQIYSVYVETDRYLSYLERRIKRDIPSASEGGRDTTEEITRERELKCGVRDAFFEHIAPTKLYADYKIANNNPDDLSNALGQVVQEVIAKLNLVPAKPSYSVAELIKFFEPRNQVQNNTNIENSSNLDTTNCFLI